MFKACVAAGRTGLGAVASGSFTLTAVLMTRFLLMVRC